MEVQYIVDSAAQLGEITPLECAALYLVEPAYNHVDKLIAENIGFPEDFLQNTARLALRTSLPDVRHWIAINSLRGVHDLYRCVKERAEFVLQTKIQMDLGRTAGPPWVRGHSTVFDSFRDTKMVTVESDVTETAARTILTKYMGDLLDRLERDSAAVDAALAWYRRDSGKAFLELQQSHRATLHDRVSLSGAAYEKARLDEKKRSLVQNKRPVRGAIKKVCKLFSRLGKEENLRMFVSGHEVMLSHPDSTLKFCLRPLGERGWLEERSAKGRAHTPFDLSVLTKDDIFIARLCVYISDTPVLDQLLALSLFIESGEELKILEKANFFAFDDDKSRQAQKQIVSTYPSLAHKFPRSRDDVMALDLLNALEPEHPIARVMAPHRAQEEHWEPFKGRVSAWVDTWFDPVFSQILPKAQLIQFSSDR